MSTMWSCSLSSLQCAVGFMVFYGAFLDVVRKRNSSGSVGVPGTSSPTEITTGLSVSCHVKLSSFVTSQSLLFAT